MGASYNTIIVPSTDLESIVTSIDQALYRLDRRIVHREEPRSYQDGFHYNSGEPVFVGLPDVCRWVPVTAWGNLLPDSPWYAWYTVNPLALNLSLSLEPVVYFFSYNSGFVAGYSIFQGGNQVEAQSLAWQAAVALEEFTPPVESLQDRTLLGKLMGQSEFDYEGFARSFDSLEVATAELAARFGLAVHLLDPFDIQDGDGGIVIEDGEYKVADLTGWIAVYYD